MGEQEAAELAKRIIQETIYGAVATSSRQAVPWNTPVFLVYDDQLHFYWASAHNSQHSQNIRENPAVFLVIYNSDAPWGRGEGVFLQAKAEELTDLDEIARACELRCHREGAANQPPSDFTGALPRRLYRATPEHAWINVDATQKGYFADGRQEVDLEMLRAALQQ